MPQVGKILGQKVKERSLEERQQKEHQCGVEAKEVQESKEVALMQEEWST